MNIQNKKDNILKYANKIIAEVNHIFENGKPNIKGNDELREFLHELKNVWNDAQSVKSVILNNDTSIIPEGVYCYNRVEISQGKTKLYLCPYYSKHLLYDEQENGFCLYLDQGDWENPGAFALLWDQCKECGINGKEEK